MVDDCLVILMIEVSIMTGRSEVRELLLRRSCFE